MGRGAASAKGWLYTIGHSHHELSQLVELLCKAGVTTVADVRSHPFSRRLPQYNRTELEAGLKRSRLAYRFLGDLLGGRPQSSDLYDEEGCVDYLRVRATDFFQRGLTGLWQALQNERVALLCAEEDPLDCHRGLMIAPALLERGVAPLHLRGDGSIESMQAMESRLLALTGVGAGILDGLFASMISAEERQEYLAEAYRKRARAKAFRLPDRSASDLVEDTFGEEGV
jgi:uncharacterized protein (DUF488 family)